MVTDQEIASCVESLLRQSSVPVTSVNVNVTSVVQQVEAKLGFDLSHKAGFIRDQINHLLRPPPPPNPSKDHHHFALQHHPQLYTLAQQQQFLHPNHQHQQLLQQHQIAGASPFTHLPDHHELAFRCTPVTLNPHQQFQHHQQQEAVAAAVMQKQESHFVAGSAGAAPAAPKASAPTGVKRRGGPGGLSKVCGVSPELQVIVGEPAMPRTQIVKQLWAYIRKNNLQDPSNKRKIICNDELRVVFETDCTDMFKMNKLLAKHIIPLEPNKVPGPDSKRLKTIEVVSTTETDIGQYPAASTTEINVGQYSAVSTTETNVGQYPAVSTTETNVGQYPVASTTETNVGQYPDASTTESNVGQYPGASTTESNVSQYPMVSTTEANVGQYPAVPTTETSVGQYPVVISDELAKFFGTGERELLRSEVLKRIWHYIKVNQLEDAMMVMCDDKLQQLFGCESLSALGVNEMVGHHVFKQS